MLVVAQPIKNVAGHVNDVPRSRRELSEFLRALERQLRMIAPFHGGNPVMIHGGVVGIIVQQAAQQRLPVKRARARIALAGSSLA